MAVTVRWAWVGRWAGPARVTSAGGRVRVEVGVPAVGAIAEGAVLPGLRDAHVHLELVDPRALFAGGIDEVYDLGARLDAVATWPSPDAPAVPGVPRIRFAGQFLTAPGGYPGDRGWAPAGSVREMSGPADGAAAVREQSAAGADFVKIALNAAAGPVPDESTLTAVVDTAHGLGLGVIAHAEGAGQTARSVAAGVDVLAHTPWTELLDDALLAAAARSTLWISTIDIHRDSVREVAVENLRRFHAAGGRIRYGTDLGNGDLPVGPNPAEVRALLDAGLSRDRTLGAMIDGDAAARFASRPERVTWIPGAPPDDDHAFAQWLTRARIVGAADIDEELR